MAIRYSDMSLEESGAYDFVARQRTPTISQLSIIFLSTALIAVSIVVSVHNTSMLLFTLFALFAIIGWYVIYQLMRSRDILLATEFQNSMFASAMGLNNKFCLIIKRDGGIVYLDRSFQTLFPDFIQQSNRSISSLLKIGKVTREDSDKVTQALDQGIFNKVIFNITDIHGITHHVVLSIEPILRPAGFVLLRGREYVKQRLRDEEETTVSSSRLFDKSSIALFSDAMEHLKMGLYMASPTGNLIYCNPLLESWLGYNEGEIIAKNLNISHLIPTERNGLSSADIRDMESDVQMARKVGGFIRTFVNQKIIHDGAGKPLGITAVVHVHPETQNDDSKKKTF